MLFVLLYSNSHKVNFLPNQCHHQCLQTDLLLCMYSSVDYVIIFFKIKTE